MKEYEVVIRGVENEDTKGLNYEIQHDRTMGLPYKVALIQGFVSTVVNVIQEDEIHEMVSKIYEQLNEENAAHGLA